MCILTLGTCRPIPALPSNMIHILPPVTCAHLQSACNRMDIISYGSSHVLHTCMYTDILMSGSSHLQYTCIWNDILSFCVPHLQFTCIRTYSLSSGSSQLQSTCIVTEFLSSSSSVNDVIISSDHSTSMSLIISPGLHHLSATRVML